jgi:hypothetical protein
MTCLAAGLPAKIVSVTLKENDSGQARLLTVGCIF